MLLLCIGGNLTWFWLQKSSNVGDTRFADSRTSIHSAWYTHREIITPRELLELVPKTTPIRVLWLLPIRYYGNFWILHLHPTILRRHPFPAFGYFADTPSLRLGTSPTPLSVTPMGTSRSTYTPMGSQFVVPYRWPCQKRHLLEYFATGY